MTHDMYRSLILEQLIGGKIDGVVINVENPDDPFDMYGLRIQMPDKNFKLLWFVKDDEGNGPGSFIIDN